MNNKMNPPTEEMLPMQRIHELMDFLAIQPRGVLNYIKLIRGKIAKNNFDIENELWVIEQMTQGLRNRYQAAESAGGGSGQPRNYTDKDLRYSKQLRCNECGAGMAYVCDLNIHGRWQCSALLKGEVEEGTRHTTLPFTLWDVKSEGQPSAKRQTTRPKGPPRPAGRDEEREWLENYDEVMKGIEKSEE